MKLIYKKSEYIPVAIREHYILKNGEYILKDAAPLLEELTKNRAEVNRFKIQQKAVDAVMMQATPRNTSLEFIRLRASDSFQIGEDGEIESRDRSGKKLFDADGMPLTFETFTQHLISDAGFLFEPGSVEQKKAAAKPGSKKKELDPVEKLARATIDARSINGESLKPGQLEALANGTLTAV